MIFKNNTIKDIPNNLNPIILYLDDNINNIDSFINIWQINTEIFNKKNVVCMGKRKFDISLWLKMNGINTIIIDYNYQMFNKRNIYYRLIKRINQV